jgi:hypothetical protein
MPQKALSIRGQSSRFSRYKLGLDVAIEALRFARERKRISNREILGFARLLRQDRVMGPYLESVT